MTPRPDKVSQSLLARLEVCPHSALLYLRHKDERVQTHAMSRGEAFHQFAEVAIQQMIRDGEPKLPADVGRELMENVCDERKDLVIPHHERDALRAMAWNWSEGTEVNLANPPILEVMPELQLGDWIVRGRIDRVDVVQRDAYIRDYKTSLSTRSQEDFEKSFQTHFYALLWSEGMIDGKRVGEGVDTFHLAEEYPRFLSKRCDACGNFIDGHEEECECGSTDFDPPALFRRRLTIGKRELHDFKRTVINLLDKLEASLASDEWPASPGSHCSTCPAQPECPLPRSQRPVEVTSQEDAVALAQDVDRQDAALKRDKKALREWAKEEGPIIMGDQEWSFTPVLSNSTDKEAMAQALSEQNVDPRRFIKSTTTTRFGKKRITA